jgi:hypothetical protein
MRFRGRNDGGALSQQARHERLALDEPVLAVAADGVLVARPYAREGCALHRVHSARGSRDIRSTIVMTAGDESGSRGEEVYVTSVQCELCGMRPRVPDGQDAEAVAREFRQRHRCTPRVKVVRSLASEGAARGNGATALSH